jgi:hypothetical protein
MKKRISIILFSIFCFNIAIAQRANDDWAKKNIVRFNFGGATLTRGDMMGSIFAFEYSRILSNKITIGGRMTFINAGRPSYDFYRDTTAIQLKRKNSFGEFAASSQGLILLEENEFTATHTNGNFILTYTPINKKRKTLSFSAGIGFGYVSTIDLSEAYRADVIPVMNNIKQRAFIYVPSYATLLDITFPVSMRYEYYFKKNWSFGGELGATLYSKYRGWYNYVSLSVGVRFD